VRRIDTSHLLVEGLALGLHTWGVALLGVMGLFLPRDTVLFQDAGDGAEVAADIQAFPQLGEGGVGLVADQLEQTFDRGGVECRRGTARMGRWSGRTTAAVTLQQPDHEGQADGKDMGNLPDGVFAAFDGSNDSLPEVGRVGAHVFTSSTDASQAILFRMRRRGEPL
jgi:hypothetical protein